MPFRTMATLHSCFKAAESTHHCKGTVQGAIRNACKLLLEMLILLSRIKLSNAQVMCSGLAASFSSTLQESKVRDMYAMQLVYLSV